VGWFRRRSLRARLMFIGTGGLAVGLLVGGLLILTVLNYVLVHSLDANSRQTAREVGSLVEANSVPALIPSTGTELVQVLDGQNRIRAATAGADRLVPLLRPSELAQAEDGAVVVIPADRVGESGTLRVVALVAGSGDAERVVLVAAPTHTVEESNEAVRAILLIAYPLLVAALALLAWRVVGWALRPVEELRQGAERISASGRRAGPLPVPDGDDEVHRLAVTLNDMLDRLDAGRARQRAFVADAAHELRSPIASLRTQLEVADRLGEAAPAADLITDVSRLSRLVDDLLLLARADEGDPALRLDEAVDLTTIAHDAAASQAGARVPVTVDGNADPVWAVGDPVSMRRIVDNLVGNAVRHASTRVRIAAEPMEAGSVRLRVSDDGPGIPAADRERVFDRFTRLDNARARDEGGAGLGLAIVRELVRQHSGTVTLGDAEPGLQADVTLPAGTPKALDSAGGAAADGPAAGDSASPAPVGSRPREPGMP
jgi:signal transduction histidine kinase